MGQAIGQVLTFGVGVALSPMAIIGVVLMLATPRARANGPAFLAGWVLALSAVGTAVLVLSSGAGATDSGEPADWVYVLKLVIGALLLLVADGFTAPRAAGLAVVLAAVNPKNLLLAVGAAAAIAQTDASSGAQAVALAVFVLIGALGPGIPVAIYFGMGDRSAQVLDHLKRQMSHNNAAIMATICVIVGAKLIGDGISGLGS